MNARQKRIKRRSEERKREKENRELIERYKRDGISYSFKNDRVEKVEVEILADSPPPTKRVPIVIDDPTFKKRSEKSFNVSNELFSELAQRWMLFFGIMKSREEK